jgi:hypothetical protein
MQYFQALRSLTESASKLTHSKAALPQDDEFGLSQQALYKDVGREVVPAPLDIIPLFVKSGTMIPTFDSQIDTLVKEDRDDLNGFDDTNTSIKVLFYGEGEDEFTIWDRTRFYCESRKQECRVFDAPIERTYSFEFK